MPHNSQPAQSETSKEARVHKQRNLFVHVPNDKKEKLKLLAVHSGMSLEAYVAAVLNEAIKNKDEFVFIKKNDLALAN